MLKLNSSYPLKIICARGTLIILIFDCKQYLGKLETETKIKPKLDIKTLKAVFNE